MPNFYKNINNFFRNIRYSLYIFFINKNKIKINLSPLKNNLLTNLMNKYGSDKGNINNKHNYTKFYESIFSDIKDKKINFLEVGIGSVDRNTNFQIIDIPHSNNIHDNCLIFIKK